MTLFKIKAHFGYKGQESETYYAIAEDSTSAENKVTEFHKKQGYTDVDFCHLETIAKTGDYSKPSILLI